MGQFFRGTTPLATRNKIWQPNFDLMGKVLGVVEGQIEKGEEGLDVIDNILKNIKYLEQDKDRTNEIVGAYNKESEKYTNLVAENPLEFRKHLGGIKSLGKQLSNDYTAGELSAIQSNYTAREKFIEEQKKRIAQKDSGLTDQNLNLMLNYQDKNFKGTSWKDKSMYNKYGTENIIADPNIRKIADEIAKDYKASLDKKHYTHFSKDGKYTISGINSLKAIDPLELSRFVSNGLQQDSRVQNYLKQYQKIAELSNEDIAGLIKNASLSAGQKYGFSERETGVKSISANQYSLMNYGQKLKDREALMSNINVPVKSKEFGVGIIRAEQRKAEELCKLAENIKFTQWDVQKDPDATKLKAYIEARKNQKDEKGNPLMTEDEYTLTLHNINKILDDYQNTRFNATYTNLLPGYGYNEVMTGSALKTIEKTIKKGIPNLNAGLYIKTPAKEGDIEKQAPDLTFENLLSNGITKKIKTEAGGGYKDVVFKPSKNNYVKHMIPKITMPENPDPEQDYWYVIMELEGVIPAVIGKHEERTETIEMEFLVPYKDLEINIYEPNPIEGIDQEGYKMHYEGRYH